MSDPIAIITLLTDFGSREPFAGVMKGMILGIAPSARIVDLTHEIAPQDVAEASYHISNAWHHFPPGTVHVAVVDPGVGSSRRALAVSSEGHRFLAPDNGLLTPLLERPHRAFAIGEGLGLPPPASATFHGRDVFAPAAASLANGAAIESLGRAIDDPVRDHSPSAVVAPGSIRARVVHVDRFGNLIVEARRCDLERAASRAGAIHLSAEIAGRRVTTFVDHYAAARGELCFLINSDGRLELAHPGGSAAATLGLARGAEVHIAVT